MSIKITNLLVGLFNLSANALLSQLWRNSLRLNVKCSDETEKFFLISYVLKMCDTVTSAPEICKRVFFFNKQHGVLKKVLHQHLKVHQTWQFFSQDKKVKFKILLQNVVEIITCFVKDLPRHDRCANILFSLHTKRVM